MLIRMLLLLNLLFCVFTVICAEGEVMMVTSSDSSNSDVSVDDDEAHDIFVASNEWKTILPGQHIPRGLHVRINLETGLKEAKLLKEEVHSSDAIKESLIKINDEGNTIQSSDKPEKRFRTIEEIRDEFAKTDTDLSTETEIISSIIAKCFEDITDEQRVRLFDELEYYVHQYDNAKDFIKMGGLKLISPALNSSNDNLKISAANLIGSAMQGNPSVQVAALDNGVLQLILHRLAVDSTKVQLKLLYALSSMIRRLPYAQKKFMELGGMSVLTKFFGENGENAVKLQMKSITLLFDLIDEKKTTVDNAGPEDVDKVRQYSEINALDDVIKHSWCKAIPKLLQVVQQHEFREKVLLFMLITLKSCREDYLVILPQLKMTKETYLQLASQHVPAVEDPNEISYYEEILQLITNIFDNLTQSRDEL